MGALPESLNREINTFAAAKRTRNLIQSDTNRSLGKITDLATIFRDRQYVRLKRDLARIAIAKSDFANSNEIDLSVFLQNFIADVEAQARA